jgi:hypothetical protein
MSSGEPAQVWVEIWGIWKPVFAGPWRGSLVPDREMCERLAERWNESRPWGPGTRYEVRPCAGQLGEEARP